MMEYIVIGSGGTKSATGNLSDDTLNPDQDLFL